MNEELSQYIATNISIPAAAYTYRFSTNGGPQFPIVMAAHLNEYFNPHSPVTADQILSAAGLTAIHEMVGLSLGDPGDGVLVSRPYYGRFELDFGNTAGLRLVPVSMEGRDLFSAVVVEQYQKALNESVAAGVHIKALLIVNPHNPLGSVLLA